MKIIRSLKEKIRNYFDLIYVNDRHCLTFNDYYEWDKHIRKTYPVRYFIAMTMPVTWNKFKNKVWYAPIAWIIARTISKSHVLKIRSLTPGYPDDNDIMLHANFQILTNFVEKRLSQTNHDWWDEHKPKYMPKLLWDKVRWYARNPEAGVAHLTLFLEDGPNTGMYADTLELYKWWTEMYPRRFEEWGEEKIWGKGGDMNVFMEIKVPGTNHKSSAVASAMETYYKEEEQEMLERLVKIRSSLWF